MLTFGSLFAGIGGFDLGFGAAGFTPTWQVEKDKYANRVLEHHWPGVARYSDVQEVGRRELGRPDLICGGFPCQDLSVAGRRAGLAGMRSGLWFEYARIVREARPRWVVIENVPGLLSSRGGRDMGAVLGTLADLGYGYAYRVLDAQFFGLAQRRKRVFVVARLGDGAGAAQVLLDEEGGVGDLAPGRQAGPPVAALTQSGLGGGGPDDNLAQAGHLSRRRSGARLGDTRRWVTHDIAPCLQEREGKGNDSSATRPLIVERPGGAIAFHQTQDPISSIDVAPRLGATSIGMGVLPFDTTQITSALNRSVPRVGDPCHPLAAGAHPPTDGHGGRMGVRRLTPLECERLQGFPDGHTSLLSDTRRYRTLGNAVAVPVITWLGRRIWAYEMAWRAVRDAA